MTILIQAPTTEWLGRKLGLLETTKGWPALAAPCSARGSDRGIPDHRNLPVAAAVFLHIRQRGERIMEALYPHLVGHQHVIDLAAGSFRHAAILIQKDVPVGMADKQERHV